MRTVLNAIKKVIDNNLKMLLCRNLCLLSPNLARRREEIIYTTLDNSIKIGRSFTLLLIDT